VGCFLCEGVCVCVVVYGNVSWFCGDCLGWVFGLGSG
jgi:hypothetical protein